MAKPTDDPQLEQRVAALEQRAAVTDEALLLHEQEIADLGRRVEELENEATEPPIDPEPEPTEGLSAVILYNGQAYAFSVVDAVDLGDYFDPAGLFTQACFLATNSLLPGFTVLFRPDTDSDRLEVVFELGNMHAANPANMGAYDVEIYDGEDLVAQISVPTHYWFARWRWQSAPRRVRVTPGSLIASSLVPYFVPGGGALARFNTDLAPHAYEIMEFAGLTASMHWTGEREDIGPVTGWQANWLCNGANEATVLAQGEASGTIGMHVRDPDTGAPLDLLVRWPTATFYAGNGDPVLQRCAGLVTYDTGHAPCPAYLPWLMTGDPYFLEELQFQANQDMLDCPANKPTQRYDDAGRYGAWPQRNKLYADVACPEQTPGWLLPHRHFSEHLERTREVIIADMAKPDMVYQVFRSRSYGGSQGTVQHPAGCIASLWQDEMELAVYALCVKMGYPWREQLAWKVQSQIRRTDGISWARCTPVPYNTSFHYTCNLATECDTTTTTLVLDKYGAQPWPPLPFEVRVDSEAMLVTAISAGGPQVSWTVQRGHAGTVAAAHIAKRAVYGPAMVAWVEAWERNEALYPEEFPRQPDDPTGLTQLYHASGGSVESPAKLRGALAIAVRAGATEAIDALAWVDGEFQRWTTSQWRSPWRWCMA